MRKCNAQQGFELNCINHAAIYKKGKTVPQSAESGRTLECMYSPFAVSQAGVKSCGLWRTEPCVTCSCPRSCPETATSQLGFLLRTFDSLFSVVQKGKKNVQFKQSPHGPNVGPWQLTASHCIIVQALFTSVCHFTDIFCSRLLVSHPSLPPSSFPFLQHFEYK